MDLDSFFGLEKIIKEIMILGNYSGPEDDGVFIVFIHFITAALVFIVSVLTSPLKVFRPLFSWLGAIWLQLTFMAVFFIGLAFFITKGDLTISRVLYLYSALFILTIVMHADLSRLMPKGVLTYGNDNSGRIDFSFHTKGKVPK